MLFTEAVSKNLLKIKILLKTAAIEVRFKLDLKSSVKRRSTDWTIYLQN